MEKTKEIDKKQKRKPEKIVILAGGMGTRISEETSGRPKPMVEIGGMPILWHIMKIYSTQGFNEFIICAGYKQDMIKKWFSDYFLNTADVTFDFTEGRQEKIFHNRRIEPWKVTVINTGMHTETGGRIERIKEYIKGAPFMVTYGDGVGDIDIAGLLEHHRKSGKKATITTHMIGQNKGIVELDEKGNVRELREKSGKDGRLVNIGFMVFEDGALDGLLGDDIALEQALSHLAEKGELSGYTHGGFWQCMDTLREKRRLEALWEAGSPPWKVWED